MKKYAIALLVSLALSTSVWAKVTTITVVNDSGGSLDNVAVHVEGHAWGSSQLTLTEGSSAGLPMLIEGTDASAPENPANLSVTDEDFLWYNSFYSFSWHNEHTYYVNNHFNISAANRCRADVGATITATIKKADQPVTNSIGTPIDVYAVEWSGCSSVSTGNSNLYCLSSYNGGCGIVD